MRLHEKARTTGVQPVVLFIVRALFTPVFLTYFRMKRLGREHIPREGAVIIAANHRSFLDPFVIGCMTRRPIYYVAKSELFRHPFVRWFLSSLGAFPVRRGAADGDMLETAKRILARGDVVLIFPEGTRVRPGSLGKPKRGVGRLVLETGAPVIPIAVVGTEDVRKGRRIRPRKVRVRAGAPLTFPQTQTASPQLAQAVADRIWPSVALQWEALGGPAPLRRAAVIGAGSWGTAMAIMLARAGLEVELGTRSAEQAAAIGAAGENEHYLPGVPLPPSVTVRRAAGIELAAHDLVCLAVPAHALPAALAEHGSQIPRRAAVLVLSKGLVPPLGSLPVAYVEERVQARAVAMLGGPAHAKVALLDGASLVLASADPGFRAQLGGVLADAGFDVVASGDVVGVELAAAAKNAAALAAAAAGHAGPNAAGSAAGKVFAEVDAFARSEGAHPETFAGLAGAGDLVATVLAESSRNRRAGELLAQGVAGDAIDPLLGQTAEAVHFVPLLAERVAAAGHDAPVLLGLAGVIEGRVDPDAWTASLTAPRAVRRRDRAAAA
jgi:1-acyl-sn-glycerol-3-phosphate acyltransferase